MSPWQIEAMASSPRTAQHPRARHGACNPSNMDSHQLQGQLGRAAVTCWGGQPAHGQRLSLGPTPCGPAAACHTHKACTATLWPPCTASGQWFLLAHLTWQLAACSCMASPLVAWDMVWDIQLTHAWHASLQVCCCGDVWHGCWQP